MSSPDTPSYSRSLPAVSLFSESPLISLNHVTGPGGDDLSLSELSIVDTPPVPVPYSSRTGPPRFSLFGRAEDAEDENLTGDLSHVIDPSSRPEESGHEAELQESLEENDENVPPETPVKQGGAGRQALQSRDEELRSTLFQLRKLNSIFNEYTDALQKSEAHSRRLLEQVETSHRLLNFYTSLLGQTEHTTRLLLDSGWQGALADEDHAAELVLIEARDRERRVKEEQERLDRLEQERLEKEEKERRAVEEREKAKSERGRGDGRSRGRGGASSTRGSAPSGSTSSVRGRGIPTGIRRPAAGRSAVSRARGRGGKLSAAE